MNSARFNPLNVMGRRKSYKFKHDKAVKKTERKPEKDLLGAIKAYICALCNSGGGVVSISFDKIAQSERLKYVDLIRTLVSEMRSDKINVDFAERNSIILVKKNSEEIVTMNYNTFIMKDGEAKSVQSIAEIRSLLNSPVITGLALTVRARIKSDFFKAPSTSSDLKERKLKLLEDDTSQIHKSVAYRITLPKNELKKYVSAFANSHGGEIYYGVGPDGIISGEIVSRNEENEIKCNVQNAIESMLWPTHVKNKQKFWRIVFHHVKNDYPSRINHASFLRNLCVITIIVYPCQGGVFVDNPVSFHVAENALKRLTFPDWYARVQNSSSKRLDRTITCVKIRATEKANEGRCILESLKRLHWVENFHFVDGDGKCNERHLEIIYKYGNEPLTDDILKYVGKEFSVVYREGSKDEWFEENILDANYHLKEIYVNELMSKRFEWVEGFKIVNNSKERYRHSLEIVCKPGKVPCNPDIVELFGEGMLPFIIYKESSLDKWFETHVLDKNLGICTNYKNELEKLEWLESFKVVGANEECSERHLEIVYKLGKVPRNGDLVNIFGKQILSFITYNEGSKHEWFKANILGRNSGGEKNYKTQLAKFSWVKDFNIGIAKEPEKSWQIYITCAQNQVPSMVELKKLFGVNIALFVDFIQESREEDLAPPCLLQGPRSGDKIRVVEDEQPKGTVGILCSDQICVEVEDGLRLKGTVRIQFNTKHYATTCYHVCFKKKLPKDVEEVHKLLKNDCANHNSRGCQGATCVYTMTDDEENQLRQLGKFCRGLYDDDHDIALVEMKSELDCTEAVDFVARNQIETELADIKQVEDIFFEMNGRVPVEKIGSVTGVTRGELIKIDAAPPLGSPGKAPCYKIECEKKKETKNIKREGNDDNDNDKKQEFAKEGDSGSLVYLLYKERRIPFAYVYSKNANVFCRNLLHSITKLINDIRPCLNPHQEVNNQI